MPITPYLRNEAFEPDVIEEMSAAFMDACKTLGLVDRADPLTEIVAQRVIELAQRGIRTRAELYAMTVKDLKAHSE
jgi:hypothetical protein